MKRSLSLLSVVIMVVTVQAGWGRADATSLPPAKEAGASVAAPRASAAASLPRLVIQAGLGSGAIGVAGVDRTGMAVSPDGNILALADERDVIIVDARSGSEVRRFPAHSGTVNNLYFSSDGARLLSVADFDSERFHRPLEKPDDFLARSQQRLQQAAESGTLLEEDQEEAKSRNEFINSLDMVKLWDPVSGIEIGKLTGLDGTAELAQFCDDGRVVVADAFDIALWGKDLKLLSKTSFPASPRHTVAISRDCSRALAFRYGDSRFAIINPATGQVLREVATSDPVAAANLVGPNDAVAVGSKNGKIAIYEPAGFSVVVQARVKGGIRSLRGTRDSYLVSVLTDGREEVALLDIRSGGLKTFQDTPDPARPPARYSRASLSSDGRTLFAVGYTSSQKISRWNTETGHKAWDAQPIEADLTSMLYVTGSAQLCALGSRGTCWDTRSGELAGEFQVGAGIYLYLPSLNRGPQVVNSPDGKSYFAFDDKVITWTDMASQKVLATFAGTTPFNTIAISASGAKLAAGDVKGAVTVWDTRSGTVISTFRATEVAFESLVFSPDEKLLACGDAVARLDAESMFKKELDRNILTLWDLASGKPQRELRGAPRVQGVSFSQDGALIAAGSGSDVVVWDVASGGLLHRLPGHSSAVNSTVFLPGPDRVLASNGVDRRLVLWDTGAGRQLATLFSLADGTWLVVDPSGRFDTNRLEEIHGLNWVMPDDPLTPLPLEIFMREYYEPRLLARILAREQLRPVRDLAELNRIQPEVEIAEIKRSGPDTVAVTVRVRAVSGTVPRQGKQVARLSGVRDLKLFRDGKLVRTALENAQVEAATRGGLITFEGIRLPRREGAGQVEFSAYAFNDDGVKSATGRRSFTLPADLQPARGRIFLINIGVNRYQNSDWNLNFAVNDAMLMNRVLTKHLKSGAGERQLVPVVLADEHADKATLHEIFSRLAGKGGGGDHLRGIPGADLIDRALPEDIVIVSYSGHGYADDQGLFYLFPHDTGPGSGRQVAESLLGRLVSSKDLESWYRDVDAGQFALIVDACHSAASVGGSDFKPGPMGSRGLGQLAYDKGIRILAASQADDVALESDKLQQGLLTYALLQDGIEELQADFKPRDGEIGLAEWLSFGVERVPVLAEQVKTGKIVSLSRGEQSRAVVRIGASSSSAPARRSAFQKPALFDFTRAREDLLILKTGM